MNALPQVFVPPAYSTLRGDREWPATPVMIYPCADIPANQIGYGFDTAGQRLPGWEANWLVIGHDELIGDPIFIDSSEPSCLFLAQRMEQAAWSHSDQQVGGGILRIALRRQRRTGTAGHPRHSAQIARRNQWHRGSARLLGFTAADRRLSHRPTQTTRQS